MKSKYAKRKIQGVTLSTHRVVWEEAHGPIPSGMQVHHKDHDRFNNRLDNLEVLTTEEHGLRHSKYPRVKNCEVCGKEYRPEPTKRKRSKSCSRDCMRVLMSRAAFEREAARRLSTPRPQTGRETPAEEG